jgi:predicted methyltransferase
MEIFLDARAARAILDAAAAGPGSRTLEVSLDLNLGRRRVDVAGDAFAVEGTPIPLLGLERIATAGRKAFRLVTGREAAVPRDPAVAGWKPLEILAGGYHQIVTTPGSPTVEIDGIQMHRTSGTDPFESAGLAARSVVRSGHRVLDTCGGLGYTAIQAVRAGASDVVSAEPGAGVLHLRRLNPWSRLEAGLPIRLLEEDAAAVAARLEPGSFDAIIHDPPRFSLAPDLYSAAFYVRLRSLLARGGRIFHYTGSPYSRGRGRDFLGGVVERLRDAGFHVEPRGDLQGFVLTPARGRRKAGRT